MFKLLRFYSIASFVSIFLAAAILTLFYRQVTIQWIIQIAQRSDLALAQATLNPVNPALMEYLNWREHHAPDSLPIQTRTAEFTSHFRNLMYDTSVVAVKIYNRDGIVAFSTQPGQIGSNQRNNAGFQTAIQGRVASDLIYRDTFNRFDQATAEDNLMQTYIPVRHSAGEPVQGVFEIYTDINPLVKENERNLLITLIGAETILALLYAVLVLVVRRAHMIIGSQQRTIQERTALLETLSAQLMNNEEQQKKKIAKDLHEGLAQTLSAIKMNVESSRSRFDASKTGTFSLEPIIHVLKGAIQEVRSIATNLRPSSLDDLGLLPTINWFCREFERIHPGTRIEREIALQENEVPSPLKIVIYRVIESAFKNIEQPSQSIRARLTLQRSGKTITLLINNTEAVSSGLAEAFNQETSPDLHRQFSEMLERTTLSGGTFSASGNETDGFTLCATWSVIHEF